MEACVNKVRSDSSNWVKSAKCDSLVCCSLRTSTFGAVDVRVGSRMNKEGTCRGSRLQGSGLVPCFPAQILTRSSLWPELVEYFRGQLRKDPDTASAVAAIRTLLEFLKRDKGRFGAPPPA